MIAIDPGPEKSAYVYFDERLGAPTAWAIMPNDELLHALSNSDKYPTVIEMVASYGMPVGAEVFETCVWIGRFIEAAKSKRHGLPARMTRAEVKMALCHRTAKVTDAVIRQRVIDIYGGKKKAIGTKKNPGPLYGIKSDCWQALALALAWVENQREAK